MFSTIFKNKSLNKNKLIPFGFSEQDGIFYYSTEILNGQFKMHVEISKNGDIATKVIDTATEDEYTLHLIESASGTFVGSVRSEFKKVLTEIADNCFETDVFKSEQAHAVIQYVKEKYGDSLEFLWEKFSSNAIWRRKDNNKWYGIILTLSKRKLGINSDEIFPIIDLRAESETIEAIVDNNKYFPGYHMNKKHWFTICLDGLVPSEEIYEFIDKSYLLAKGK